MNATHFSIYLEVKAFKIMTSVESTCPSRGLQVNAFIISSLTIYSFEKQAVWNLSIFSKCCISNV